MMMDDAQREMQKLLSTKEGQKLLQLLSSDGGKALTQASKALRSGNEDSAKAVMAPLLQDSQVQSLLKSLEKAMGHG